MLREEVEQYTKLTGDDGWHVPIMKIGAYLDGYNKGLEILDKIRADIAMKKQEINFKGLGDYEKAQVEMRLTTLNEILQIIDKYKESED